VEGSGTGSTYAPKIRSKGGRLPDAYRCLANSLPVLRWQSFPWVYLTQSLSGFNRMFVNGLIMTRDALFSISSSVIRECPAWLRAVHHCCP